MSTFSGHKIHAIGGPALEQPFYRKYGFTEAPVVIQCYLTLRCAFSCAHCLAHRAGSTAQDMPLELFEKLCREAAALGVAEMLLTGGEPLQRADLDRIVDCLQRYGLSWSLNTAGCPTQSQQAALYRYPPDYVAVSLDGPADVHNAFRGCPNAFESALASLRFFSEISGTTVCAGTTLTTHNLPYLEEAFALVRQSGAHRWGLHLLIPEGRAHTRKDLFPAARQMRRVLKSIALKRRIFPVSLCDEMGFAGEWEALVRDEAFYCAAGRAMCAVLPDGSVMPCSTLDPKHVEGNLTLQSLAEIWRTGFMVQRAPRREGKCSRCQDWAACGSGCWLQRTHGTQCFKHLWKMPEAVKAAASIGFCLGALQAQPCHSATPSAVAGGNEAPGAITGSATNTPGLTSSGKLMPKGIPMGIYGSKASGGYSSNRAARLAADRSLRWLKDNQQEDGTWGEPRHRVMLTALVTLAFLSQGHTPTSEAYGKTVERALQALISGDSGVLESDVRGKITALWCLAEAHALTHTPELQRAILERIDRLMVSKPTPWHALAWCGVSKAISHEVLKNRRSPNPAGLVPPSSRDLLDEATRCLVILQAQGLAAAQVELPALYALHLEKWRRSEEPLMTALFLNMLAKSGARNLRDWSSIFTHEMIKAQASGDSVGWWDVQRLDLAAAKELQGMSEADARMYTTALVVISLSPPRIQSPYR